MNLNKTRDTLMRNLHLSVNSSHLVYRFYFRRQSSMNAQDFVVYQSSKRKVIKGVIEIFPGSRTAILFDYLIIKTVDCGNLSRLMVASEQDDIFWIFQFVAEQKFDGLDGVVSAVYEISDKNIAGSWEFPSYFEKLKHIKKLAMNITTYGNRCLRFLHVAFLEKKFLDAIAESPYAFFLQVFAGFQLGYPSIYLHFLNK